MNSISARCGHVKRRLRRGEPLEGKTLEFALSTLEREENAPSDAFWDGIVAKLKAGEKLGDYEYHCFVEMHLVHVRLGALAAGREAREKSASA